ncbi:MAG: hypothetical protein PHC95_05880 [Parabacteroides sp.]|nr:hypothetical protein [Parabacteroides sp.]
MTTMELDSRRMELIRDIMDTDSLEVLDKVKRAFTRAIKSVEAKRFEPIPGVPSTLEEVKRDIADFEAELDAGTLETVPHEEVMKEMRKLIASL